jgi:hypothetical protein
VVTANSIRFSFSDENLQAWSCLIKPSKALAVGTENTSLVSRRQHVFGYDSQAVPSIGVGWNCNQRVQAGNTSQRKQQHNCNYDGQNNPKIAGTGVGDRGGDVVLWKPGSWRFLRGRALPAPPH